MVKGEWSFTHFQDHLSFVAIADAAGAASGNTTAEVPEADACSRGGRRDSNIVSFLFFPVTNRVEGGVKSVVLPR